MLCSQICSHSARFTAERTAGLFVAHTLERSSYTKRGTLSIVWELDVTIKSDSSISNYNSAPHTMIVAFVCASAVWASARAACPAASPPVNDNRGSCDSRQLRTDSYADCQAACCE